MKIKTLFACLAVLCLSLFALPACAPVHADVPGLATIAQGVQAAPVISADSLLSTAIGVAAQVKGSVPLGLKIAGIVLLLLAFTKVSFMAPVWKWFGAFQPFLAPLLGLVVGLLLYGLSGPLSLASLLAYAASGGGAVLLHELLDALKAVPGLGPSYIAAIGMFEGLLGGG